MTVHNHKMDHHFTMPDEMEWHPGEQKMHSLLRLRSQENPSSPFLSPGAGYMASVAPLLALGTLDKQGRPWTTILGGKPGFVKPVAQSVLALRTPVDKVYDPVVRALFAEEKGEQDGYRDMEGDGEEETVIEYPGEGKLMAGLTIDLETRMRIKLAGRFLVSALSAGKNSRSDTSATHDVKYEDEVSEESEEEEVQEDDQMDWQDEAPADDDLQAVIQITESLGNCPKYLNSKHLTPATPDPIPVPNPNNSPRLLPPEAVSLLDKADLFFISSSNSGQTMDTNHRGGPPGFVRVLSNDASSSEGAVLIYPEYSGNRLYQTLGNLQTTPLAGIVVPDFDTGDVLYLTGKTEVLIGEEAAKVLPRSNLAVKITISESRFVRNGLPFRGAEGERSMYNPPVRYTALERPAEADELQKASESDSGLLATLVGREDITPTIARFKFRVSQKNDDSKDPSKRKRIAKWKPGQHATLSFAAKLDRGYSHMRDADPKSLNDDYLRTFTVSKAPTPIPSDSKDTESRHGGEENDDGTFDFELTIRNVGRATGYLFRQKPVPVSGSDTKSSNQTRKTRGISSRSKTPTPFSLPLLGFNGHFSLPVTEKAHTNGIVPLVVGGIGITPLLGQIGSMTPDEAQTLRVLWTVNARDIGLVSDVLAQCPQLADVVTLFLTGSSSESNSKDEDKNTEAAWTIIHNSGLKIEKRRLAQRDLEALSSRAASQGKRVQDWYMCVGPELKSVVLAWLAGKRVVSEEFYY